MNVLIADQGLLVDFPGELNAPVGETPTGKGSIGGCSPAYRTGRHPPNKKLPNYFWLMFCDVLSHRSYGTEYGLPFIRISQFNFIFLL
jgi:hypothetical protein